MSDDRIAQLEAQIQHLTHQIDLIEHVDDALEEAMLYRWPVSRTMEKILEPARQRFGVKAMCLRTFNEDQVQVDFIVPNAQAFNGIDLDAMCFEVEQHNTLEHTTEHCKVIGYRLDVNDVYLGSVLLILDDTEDDTEHKHLARASNYGANRWIIIWLASHRPDESTKHSKNSQLRCVVLF